MAAAAALLALAAAFCGAPARAGTLPTSACSASVCDRQGLASEAESDASNHLLQGSAAKVRVPRGASEQSSATSLTVQLASSSLEPPAPSPLEKPFYLHVPKCGSSFETVLVHYVCGDAIPANVTVQEPPGFFHAFGNVCPESKFGRFKYGHFPLYDDTPLHTVVTMVRDPRARVLSGYDHSLHDCSSMREKLCLGTQDEDKPCLGDVRLDGRWVRNASVISPVEYARCVENCTVNLLMGQKCGVQSDLDVEAAVRKVGKLGFVGLTEEWNMSVCLFHAKFGGPVLASEVYDVRPGAIKTVGEDDLKLEELTSQAESMLKAWPATNEMRVYEAARARFWQEVELYGVSRETCQSQIDAALSEGIEIAEPLAGKPDADEPVW